MGFVLSFRRKTVEIDCRTCGVSPDVPDIRRDAGRVVVSNNGLAAPSGSPAASNALLTTATNGVAPVFCGMWGAVTLPDVGGGRTMTALAGEVLHFRIGADATQPWYGTAPLKRASLSADLLEIIERALVEVYGTAPLGSSIVPMPETPETDLADIARGFRGSRGRVLVRESVQVQAAGGPAPAQDWRANDLTPKLADALMDKTLDQARDQINGAFGILPGLNNAATTGPMVREAQRHLCQWTLQPIAEAMAEEATDKLGSTVTLDTLRPLQAFDAGGRAQAAVGIVQALAAAKEAGVDPSDALRLVDWEL